MTRYLFSLLFILAGVGLLIVPHNLRVRGIADLNFGWLVLGIGVLSLGWDYFRARRGSPAEPPKPPPGPPAQK
jgi:hypothetical protein